VTVVLQKPREIYDLSRAGPWYKVLELELWQGLLIPVTGVGTGTAKLKVTTAPII
jgi:hypothetical protein